MNKKNENYDVVVIGGGSAGLSAAIEAKRNNASVLLIEREDELGGILKQCIHPGFGILQFKENLTGPEYAEKLIMEIEKLQISYLLNTLVVDISKEKKIVAISPDKGILNIKAKAIVLSMGAREKDRGSILIPGSRPSGIYTAGVAQRFININGYLPGRDVVILGSGDIGLIMARRFTLEGANVKAVYEIQDKPSGLKRNIAQCLNDFNIPLYMSKTVVEIIGKERLEGVIISDVNSNLEPVKGTEEFVKCDTLLLSIGLIPENELSKKALILVSDKTNGPFTSEIFETSVDGIFAAGNVLQIFDLVDYVSETGMISGKFASLYAKSELQNRESKKAINIMEGENIKTVFPQKFSFTSDLVLFIRPSIEVNHPVFIDVADGFFRVKRQYARIGEIMRVKVPLEVLKDLNRDFKVSLFDLKE